MKIAVKVTIEMTPEQVASLANEYGIGDGDSVKAVELREFVKSYMREHAQQAHAGSFWTATVA